MTLADRIVVLNDGKIEQVGTPDEIYDNPKTLFVSKFMGTPPMNIFKSKVKDNAILFDDDSIKLDKDIKDSEVYVGIRAEDILLSHMENCISLEVNIDMIERLGSESLIYANVDNHMMTIKTSESLDKKLKSIKIYIDTRKLYLFSTKTNQKI
jgi:ABC-type sugar transport system ATPase subunit